MKQMKTRVIVKTKVTKHSNFILDKTFYVVRSNSLGTEVMCILHADMQYNNFLEMS